MDRTRSEPQAVIVAEIRDGKADILVRILLLHLTQGFNLAVEGGNGYVVAVLHAAGCIEEHVVNVGLFQ